MALISSSCIVLEAILITLFFFLPVAFCEDALAPIPSEDTLAIPSDKTQLSTWFDKNVQPLSAKKGTLEPVLETAEANVKVVKVNSDGSGDFKTINDAIKSVPEGNTNRYIISIGSGNYTEKIKIERTKPFITFYGDPNNMPFLVFDGTAQKYGTPQSATLIVESAYFSAVNINIVNSAPRPDGKRPGAQAVALTASGDKASFYNCKIYGFQDTLCDDAGMHLYKDCYIEGTVDFIFGSGKTLYLNTEIHVIPGDPMAVIAAQARESPSSDTGYAFVHCKITGTGGIAYLARAWKPYSSVVYAYTMMSDVVNPQGWSDNNNPESQKTLFFGEYNCSGPGANMTGRVSFSKKLTTDEEAKPFITLGFIQASKWLLPPATI